MTLDVPILKHFRVYWATNHCKQESISQLTHVVRGQIHDGESSNGLIVLPARQHI